jgi:hypothetical protein
MAFRFVCGAWIRLVVSPIAIDMDDKGDLYYATTNRQKNSEFDIRGHRDWEIESISLQTVEDKRAFLRRTTVARREQAERMAERPERRQLARLAGYDN